MKTLKVALGKRSYPIYIGSDLLTQSHLIKQCVQSKQIMVVSNTTIAPLYLQKILDSLSGLEVKKIILPDGEQYKTLDTLATVLDKLMEYKFSRNSTLIALGGGVIGDIVGFAAACYQRGIAFIQIPTTLLAQVDASVGGKTGVNHLLGKNMIGAFYQPKCVIADTKVLTTLDERQLSAGLAEVIKYGLIGDFNFFKWLEEHMEDLLHKNFATLVYAIEQSCQNKAQIVAKDELETGLRAILNLGHTFAHAIETGLGYGKYLHGEAVAIGCCQAAYMSVQMGWLDANDVERIIAIFKKANLPVATPANLSSQKFIEVMAVDKKNIDGKIRVILLKKIGQATLPVEVSIKQLQATLDGYAYHLK